MNHSIDLLSHLHQGSIVITPNNRLANQLLRQYESHYRLEIGAVAKPICLSYQDFLRYLFQQAKHTAPFDSHPVLLNAHQQRYIWRTIIAKDAPYSITTGMLNLVEEAWASCQHWQIASDHPAFGQSQQTQDYRRWMRTFHTIAQTRNLLTMERLPHYLLTTSLTLSNKTIIWTCFDDFSPIQQELQHHLEAQGCPQLCDDISPTLTQVQQFEALDNHDEYHHIVDWAKQRINIGDTRIAIVVPDLQAQAGLLHRLFAKHFTVEQFNLSIGSALTDFPIVNAALQWLQLMPQASLTHHQVRLLLQSPFMTGSQSEYVARVQCLQDNSFMKEIDIPWQQFLNQLSHTPNLQAVLQHLTIYPQKASPNVWAEHFKERLKHVGFPGDYPLDSTNYQCFNRFMLLFDELMSFNTITTQMTQQDAFQLLQELAKLTVFQIKKPQTPIQILGLLEASGCSFDSIWVSGLTDQCLPQKTRFSPFIPIDLQNTLSLPHTSAQRELILAQQGLDRLRFACQTIIYSYPKTLNDMPQLPCHLIQHYPMMISKRHAIGNTLSALIPFDEHYVLPPSAEEKVSGGTALLASQAKCPFQAFAAHRLKANSAPDVSDGLDALERGYILHRILEALWTKLKTQAMLLTIDAKLLDTYIVHIIQEALAPLANTRPCSFTPLIQEVELERLKRLVYVSLAWEKERAPFEIEALEQKHTLTLASIPFHVRIDRLDKLLAYDKKVVIDYKSSLPTSKPWFEDRPEAPQLLLYALLDPQITTLLFIQLKTGRISLSGLTEESNMLKGIGTLKPNETWSSYQEQWTQQLTQLAEEIKNGRCEPLPNKRSHCGSCAFNTLCRVTMN